MYFWKSREGNRISSKLHELEELQVLALFARRPKLGDGENVLWGKINRELFEFSGAASTMGIFSIAGFPAARSIFHLHSDPLVFWITLAGERLTDIEFRVDLGASTIHPIGLDGTEIEALSINQIYNLVNERCRLMSWVDAMNAIDELRLRHFPSHGYFGGSVGYKPIYFLLPKDGQNFV